MTTLALLNPIDPGTGSRVQLRVCSSQDPAATGADGAVWWPAIESAPTISLSLFDGDFTSAVEPGSATMSLRIDVLRGSGQFPRVERYDWAGAQVELFRLVNGALVDLATMRVEQFAMEDLALALSLSVDPEPFQADVLFSEYAGTTGIEGGANLKGTPKPWVFGRALNVEPVFIDEIDNVFQVHGYGAVSAISAVYERGASFGLSQGDFADYAALVAANLGPGQWGTCLAQGLFRLGAPPAGVITCDVDGDTTVGFIRRTGAIIKEVARRLGLSASINAASFDALDTAVARNVNIVINQQTSLLDLARRMAAPCNAVCGIGLDGRLIVSRVAFGSEQHTLDAQGRQMPPVLGAALQNTSAPYRRIVMGAARSWRVHTLDEISFYSTLTERGDYDALTVYREGDIVVTPDGSRWLYINLTADSGNAPPTWPTTSNDWWANLSGPGSGSSDGLNTATVTIYQRSATSPAAPSVTATFTFATGAVSGLNNGWSTAFPADNGQPAWRREVYVSSTAATAAIASGDWSASVQVVVSGVNGISGLLTNEAHTVAVTAGGSFSLSTAGGAFKVYSGETDVTALSTFSIVGGTDLGTTWRQDKNGLRLIINETGASAGVYSLTVPGADWTSDAETFTLRATYAGVNIDRIYSITKARSGAEGTPGTNAKTLTILSDRQTIAYDAAGAPSPATQTTTFSVNKQNTTGTVNWTITDAAGVNRTPVSSFLSAATGDTVTMTEAQFDSARNGTSGVIVTATITDGTTFFDRISVVRVQAGAPGTNGLNQATVYLYRRSATVPAVPSVTSTYTFATGVLTGQNNSWTQAIPAGTDPLYVITAAAISSGATATILTGQWATPGIIVENGISATLTSDSFTVQTDAEGFNGDYSQAGGTMLVRSGANLVAPTFSIVSTSPANSGAANLVSNPEAFNSWAALAGSVTANVATLDPLGGTTADKIFESSTATSTWGRQNSIASRPAGTYIASVHFRADERTFARIVYGTTTSNQWFGATFDLNSGTVTQQNAGSSGTVLSAGITAVGNGWYRAWVVGTVGSGTQTHQISVQPVLTGTPSPTAATGLVSYTGVTNSGLLAWGAMVQQSSVLALYAPWLTFNASTGVYTVRDPYALTATATLRATFNGVNYDRTYSLAKAPRGTPGAPGAAAITALLTNEAFQVFAYANGVVISYQGASGSFRVFQGTTDVSANFTLSTQANPQGLTVSYVGQTYSVTGGLDANEDTAVLTIRATGSGAFAGVTIDKDFTLAKARGGYEIVNSLPGVGDPRRFQGNVVFLTTDNKLYRWNGSAWTAAVPAVDITGQLADAQIAALAAAKVTGQLTDAQIAAIAAAKLTGQITTTQITDDAITAAKIAANAVTASEIAAGAVVADKIASNAVTAVKIEAGAVVAGKIAAGAVQAAEIAAGAVIAGKIAANAVTATEIASNAITADKISAGAVTAAKIGVTELTAITANIGEATAGIIRNFAGTHRFDLNQGRIIFDNGTHIKASGVGFGTSNQFLEWFGVRPSGGNLALCSEANAISYLKTNGDAYFGGSLSAGILKNAAQTTDIGAGASVTVGPFGTNGDPIQIVTSYTVESSSTTTYANSSTGRTNWGNAVTAWGATPTGPLGERTVDASKAITCNVVVRLDRGVAPGSPSSWNTLTITGGTEYLTGFEPPVSSPGTLGELVTTRVVSGSMTNTDSAGGTANRTFVATITTRTDATTGTVISQRVGIVATEE